VLAVARELAPLAEAEVGTEQEVAGLLSTGLVTRRAGGIAFGLPALAQWFAAQAVLSGETSIEIVLATPEDLELWLYPLGLVVALGGWDRSQEVLAALLEKAAGFAFRVLDVAFTQAVMTGSPAPPWREGGARVRTASQKLIDSVGALGPALAETDLDGKVLPIAVRAEADKLYVASWRGRAERPAVFPWPPELALFTASPDWGSQRIATVGEGATWAWRWARDGVRNQLQSLLRTRSIPISSDSPLAAEDVWAIACSQAQVSRLSCDSLPIAPLIERLDSLSSHFGDDDAAIVHFVPGGDVDIRPIHAYLSRLLARGDEAIDAPIPAADVDRAGGYVGEFFSDERLVEVAKRLYELAIPAYRALVDRWFRPLTPYLEHRVLMPMRVVARVNPGRTLPMGPIPSLAGYLEALPEGSDNEVVVSIDEEPYEFAHGEHSWEQQRAARQGPARWLTGGHGGLTFELGQGRPIAAIVYSWLAHDLQLLGLAGALDGGTPHNPVTVWESSVRAARAGKKGHPRCSGTGRNEASWLEANR
jgi:hypothetical protein